MKTYAEVLDSTENAMLASRLAKPSPAFGYKPDPRTMAYIDGAFGGMRVALPLADPKEMILAAARDGGKKLQREIVRRGWLTQEEIDGR